MSRPLIVRVRVSNAWLFRVGDRFHLGRDTGVVVALLGPQTIEVRRLGWWEKFISDAGQLVVNVLEWIGNLW